MAVQLARSIDSVADVEAVLRGSTKFSFSEALDCVAVCEAAQDWELLERSALGALDAVDAHSKPPETLTKAAWELVKLWLHAVHGLAELGRRLPEISEELAAIARDRSEHQRSALESVKSNVDDLALLLSDATPASYVKLCSLLRSRVHRPQLGIIAATRALNQEGQNAAALNTRGAARLDLEQLAKAEDDLARAWEIDKSHYVANTMVRLHMLRSDTTEAVRWSVIAVDAAPKNDTVALKVMAAAALAADDQAQLNHAMLRLGALQQPRTASPDRWVLVLAARQFMRDGLLTLARATLDQVLSEGAFGPAVKLDEELNREIKRRAPSNL